ncbi:MAG: hypothetical protein D6753_14350 [Planctomycetota bacterium]|nr:MAG: hypothetical protein D6753_14350 [Planctomycetota bacterium]
MRVQIGLPASADRSLLEGVNGVEVRDGVAVWTVARLEPDQHSELVLPIRLVGEGEQRLGILVEDAVGNRAAGQCVTLVQAVADLKLLVSDPIAPAPVGDDVVYELQLTNRGSKAATNVHVVAQFSEGIEPTRGEGHRYRLVPGQVLFEPLSRIDPNQTVTLKVYAVAQQAGVHRFRADVRADEEIRLVQEESTRYLTVAQNPAGGSTNR